jgi:hypothetical protein
MRLHRDTIVLFTVGALAACGTSSTPPTPAQQAAQANTKALLQGALAVACVVDAAAPALTAAGSGIAIIAGADATTVKQVTASEQLAHPVVQAACNAVLPGTVPVAVTPQ